MAGVFIISCSSKEEDLNPQNTISVDGVIYEMNYSGYLKHNDGITLYFGDSEYNDNPENSIEITLNIEKPADEDFFYGSDNEYLITSATHKTTKNGECIEKNNITKGDLSLIGFTSAFIVQYNLVINGCKIMGHHVSSLKLIE